MLASVALEHSEAVFVEDSVGSVVVVYEVDSGVVCAEGSKARALVAISLKTYTRITLAPTNNRLVGCEWTVILALLLDLPPNSLVAGMEAGSMQNPASR